MKIKINTNKNEPIVDTVKPYPDENPNQHITVLVQPPPTRSKGLTLCCMLTSIGCVLLVGLVHSVVSYYVHASREVTSNREGRYEYVKGDCIVLNITSTKRPIECPHEFDLQCFNEQLNFDQDIAFCGTGRYPEPLEDFEVGSGSGVDSASSLIRPSPQNHRLPHPRHNRDDSSSSQHVRMSKGLRDSRVPRSVKLDTPPPPVAPQLGPMNDNLTARRDALASCIFVYVHFESQSYSFPGKPLYAFYDTKCSQRCSFANCLDAVKVTKGMKLNCHFRWEFKHEKDLQIVIGNFKNSVNGFETFRRFTLGRFNVVLMFLIIGLIVWYCHQRYYVKPHTNVSPGQIIQTHHPVISQT